MTVHAQATGWRFGGRWRVVTALLALAVLVPLGVLFLDHNRHLSERKSIANQERQGIEYLLALSQVTIAFTDAQAAAVSGEQVSQERLSQAVADVVEVDDQLGDELRVRERWSQLRDMIERAASTDHADGRAAYASYEEATSLLLDLTDKLRETAGLVRDPDQDTYHLQDAAGEELPEAIVAAGRLVDLVTLAATEPAVEQIEDAAQISVGVAGFSGPVDDLVVGIQAALDSSRSRSLSSTVLGKYDRFLRAKDGLLGLVPPDGNVENVDLELLAGIRGEFQAAADQLLTALLTEIDVLVETRLSDLSRGQVTAVVSVLAAVLLVFGLVAVNLLFRNARKPALSELSPWRGSHGRGGGSEAGRGAPELTHGMMSRSDSGQGYEPRPDGQPAERLAGQLLGSERADVR